MIARYTVEQFKDHGFGDDYTWSVVDRQELDGRPAGRRISDWGTKAEALKARDRVAKRRP